MHDFLKISIKIQLGLGHFLFLAFLNMAAGDLHALQAALLLPPECLGKVCCRAIFRTPIAALLESLQLLFQLFIGIFWIHIISIVSFARHSYLYHSLVAIIQLRTEKETIFGYT
jgi:hypothetical protein